MTTVKLSRELRALGAALLAAASALGGAAVLSGALRTGAARTSHQLPATESWWAWPAPPSAALIAHGRTLFLNSCAHCHGLDAHGDEGPDLHDLQVSDRYIARTITRGIKGEMPSFARKHNAADLTALIAYVRSLPPG